MVDSHNDVSGTVAGSLIQARDVLFASQVPHARAGLPPVGVVTGREPELAQLAAVLRADTAPGAVVSVVAGLAGVGKTTLAVRAAHDAAGSFPGGVLFLDVRGYDPQQQVLPEVALLVLLRAIGVPSEHIPADQAGREVLYRSRLAESERTLVILDNASSAAQVRPLLPGTPRHRVLVTSRHTLADLTGARLIDLGVLARDESASLVDQVLRAARPDDDRVVEQPESVKKLARLCGNLPLALTIVAAILASDPDQPVDELTEALSDNVTRLSELSYGEGLGVRAAFDLSYDRLTPEEARLFRLLSFNPGQQVSVGAAAALAARNERQTAKLLESLRLAHMIETGEPRGWFRFHDLLRLYAEEQAADDGDREGAIVRMLNYYITAMDQWDDVHGTASEHARWLETERSTLVKVAVLAHELGEATYAMRLVFRLAEFLLGRRHLDDCDVLFPIALAAARRVGTGVDLAYAVGNSGELAWERRDYAAVRAHYGELVERCRRSRDRRGEALARRRLGVGVQRAGDLRGARFQLEAALRLDLRLGDRTGRIDTLLFLGALAREDDRDESALAHYLEALRLAVDSGDLTRERRVLAATTTSPGRRSAFRRSWWDQAASVYIARGRADRARVLIELLGGAHARPRGQVAWNTPDRAGT
ncbi:ATP-binding protein [Saccharothrix sp. NRRL B-16348]|uniref:ATP-binding protein n=1 Tax=Saccharothrix sp. NRRL B-16348 TaxID=1415542 RepID=UPI0006AF3604|nr:NB-ARC domain-containing protein [Saccharothrix sp. NRRL B-16348]